MGLGEYLQYFLGTDTPFMLLFVSLFFYSEKRNRDREAHLNNVIEGKLKDVHEQMGVLIKVWQILLEKELEERK